LLPFQKYFSFTFPEFLLPIMVLFCAQLPGNISVICANVATEGIGKAVTTAKTIYIFFGELTTVW
jgi:hypothetical protein